jgi:hypothetical protein
MLSQVVHKKMLRFKRLMWILLYNQGRPVGGASGALAPGADFEGRRKGGHRPATR